MVNTDVVNVEMTLVPDKYAFDKAEVIQMQMAVSVLGSDRDLEYFEFSMRSGSVIWHDDHEIKLLLDHMVSYMTRKIGNMIMRGKGKT